MGFFGKKKKQPDSPKSNSSSQEPPDKVKNQPTTLKYRENRVRGAGKSVRFANAVSDDESGFVTDSEVELSRFTRHGSLRVRGERLLAPGLQLNTAHYQSFPRSQSYDNSRTQSYSERLQTSQASSYKANWQPNGSSVFTNTITVDDDYLSDCSTASSFTRNSRTRTSLPVLRRNATQLDGLVFLSYQNQTRKTKLPSEIKCLDTIRDMFKQAFPHLDHFFLRSPKTRFYILDRSSNKFFLLTNLNYVSDGTMLKLVDPDSLTPKLPRKSQVTGQTAAIKESSCYSEPEFDSTTASLSSVEVNHSSKIARNVRTKETDVDDPTSFFSKHHNTLPRSSDSSSAYDRRHCHHTLWYPKLREVSSDWNIYDPTRFGQPSQLYEANHRAESVNSSRAEYIMPSALYCSLPSSAGLDYSSETSNLEDDTAAYPLKSPQHKDEASRQRMAKMEAQIANLTAWVQTALTSRPNSTTGDEKASEISYHSPRSSMSSGSTSTPQPQLNAELRKKIVSASTQIKDLRSDLKQLRRIHEAQSETIQESIKDAFTKIQNAVKSIPGAGLSPLRSQRNLADVSLDNFIRGTQFHTCFSRLEACVSELRADVVSKRCHVNMAEVEALALCLSKATRNAADIKSKFPRLSKEIRQVLQDEMENVVQQQQFITQEPDKIEEALRRCKAVANVLFTLKRLAAIDNHRVAVVPKLYTKLPTDSSVNDLLNAIKKITPNHEDRAKAIQVAEESITRRKENYIYEGKTDVRKSLEIASKSLREADSIPKVLVDNTCLDKLVIQAKSPSAEKSLQVNVSGAKPALSKNNGETKHRLEELTYVRNRDSINWDVYSDSDESSSDYESNHEKLEFVDVTEAPLSAFTIVNPRNCDKNPYNFNTQKEISTTHLHSIEHVPSGKVYQPPNSVNNDIRYGSWKQEELQHQCQKLLQLQKTYHHQSPVAKSLPDSTSNRSIVSTNGSNSSSKPLIAPKPVLLPDKHGKNDSNNFSNHSPDNSSVENKSTTV